MSSLSNHNENRNSKIEIVKRISVFEEEVESLLRSPDKSFPILPVIGRWLKQLKVQGSCQPKDIFLEAYKQGIREIQSGREIKDTAAYLRATSFAIVRRQALSNQTDFQ